MLAQELGKLPNKISIEGHTDSKPFAVGVAYGNWELSADRANSARRLMQENKLTVDQVSQVRGFADQRLRKPDQPFDSSNRRVSLIVQYLPALEPRGTALAAGNGQAGGKVSARTGAPLAGLLTSAGSGGEQP
jgi:chemotaxis protein MotB